MSTPTVGRYNVVESLGQGGMGMVFKAQDPMLDRIVAIKIILPGRTTDAAKLAAARDRFFREARAVARLDSPYIIKIYDIGEQPDGTKGMLHYIVMEYVPGHMLSTVIEASSGPPSKEMIAKRVQLFWQVLQGMAYAHDNGVVHRDLKPDNVMITQEGKVKVMDFGLAVLDDQHTQTRDDQIMGTIAYFAPEQAKGGKAVDHRADIYALGVMLFEILTGRLPFSASNALEMITKVMEAPPPNPSDFNPNVSWGLDKLVLRALRKNPSDRFQSATEMRLELEQYLKEQGDGERLDPHAPPRFSPPASRPEAPAWSSELRDPAPAPRAPEGPGWSSELRSGLFPMAEPAGSGYRPVSPPPSTPAVPPMSPRPTAPPMTSQINITIPPIKPPTFNAPTFPPIRPIAPGQTPPTPPPAPPTQPEISADSATSVPYMPFLHTRGSPLVASSGWMTEAKSPGTPEAAKPPERMKKDDETQARLADPNAPRLHCASCGAENPGGFTECLECGEPLQKSYFRVQTEARDRCKAAVLALQGFRFEEAASEAAAAVKADEGLGEAHLLLGRAHLGLQRLEQAEMSLERAAELLPEAPEPYLVLAELCLAKDDVEGVIACLLEVLARNPNDLDARSRLAFLYSETGRSSEAVEQYRLVLRSNPRNLTANRQMGLLLASSERNDEAIRYLEYANKLDPNDANSCTLLGRLYARKRQFNLAQEAFQTAIQLKGDDAALRSELGALYHAQNREDLAIQELNKALELDKGNRDARLRLASLYERYGKLDKALPVLEEALRYHPQDLVVHRRLGELYLQKQDLTRAMMHFEQVVQLDPGCAEMHNKLGRIYLKKNYTQRSIEQYKNAVELHKVDPDYREDLAMAYYCAGDFPLAIRELEKAATLDGRNADYFKALGMLHYAEKNDEQAVRHLQWSLQLNPGDPQARGMLGQALSRQGLTNMAITEYQKALDADANLHLVHLYLARAFAQAGRHAEAIQSFRNFAARLSALEESQFLGQAYVDMGNSYLAEGQVARAAEVFQAALQRNPKDAGAMLGLARAAMVRKDFKKARERLKEAMGLEPRNLDLLKTLAELQGEEGNWNDAVKTLQRALVSNQADPDLHETLGRALRKGGRLREAATCFHRAAETFPSRQGRFYWLEGRIEARCDRWGEAAMLYRRALERSPGYQILEDLAHACHKLGQPKEALNNLQQAIDMAPEKERASLRKLLTLYSPERPSA